jgi:thioredoxin reductase (NADPH)
MMNMRQQAERFGAEIINENFSEGDFSGDILKVKTASGKEFSGKTVLIATGADHKQLGVAGEKEFSGRGVSYCGTCDAAFFRNKNVIVVGGGDVAMEDALFLTRFANSVTVVHRRDSLRASKVMQERAKANEKISFLWDTIVTEVVGDQKVTSARLKNVKSNEETEMPIDGVFVAIGQIPNTAVFKGIDVDSHGYIVPKDRTYTNVKGVFVAGDVHDNHYKQAITAAGLGCMAALDIERYLAGEPEKIS